METLTWKQFGRLPHSLRVRGEIVFNHGPDRADIHHPLRDAAARSANGRPTKNNVAPVRLEANE